METVTMKIDGMTCGGCVDSVARVLQSVTGVQSAEVSLEAAAATVRYDPALARREQLKSAVEDAGFDAAF